MDEESKYWHIRTSISSGKLVMPVIETGSITATGTKGDFLDKLNLVFLLNLGFLDGGSSVGDDVEGLAVPHSMSLSDPPVLFSMGSSSWGEGAEAEVLRNLYLCMVDCNPWGWCC